MKKLGLFAVAVLFSLSFVAAGCQKKEAPQETAPATEQAPAEGTAAPATPEPAQPAK